MGKRKVGAKDIAIISSALFLLACSIFLLVKVLREPGYKYEIAYPENPQRYVQPENSAVQSLAGQLGTVEDCYYWVARNIKYVPDYSLGVSEYWQYPSQTIQRRKGDCEDFAILLCSLIRANGTPAEDIRVVAGLVPSDGEIAGHAWVELRYLGRWLPLESATRGRRALPFDYFLTNAHPEHKRLYWFNDVYYENFA